MKNKVFTSKQIWSLARKKLADPVWVKENQLEHYNPKNVGGGWPF